MLVRSAGIPTPLFHLGLKRRKAAQVRKLHSMTLIGVRKSGAAADTAALPSYLARRSSSPDVIDGGDPRAFALSSQPAAVDDNSNAAFPTRIRSQGLPTRPSDHNQTQSHALRSQLQQAEAERRRYSLPRNLALEPDDEE